MLTRNKTKKMDPGSSNLQKLMTEYGFKSEGELKAFIKKSKDGEKSLNQQQSSEETRNVRTLLPSMSAYKPKENIANYVKRLKYWLKSSHIEGEDTKNTILTVIGDYAFEQLAAHFEDVDAVSVDDIFEAMEACFGCNRSIWHERLCFESIIQKPGETMAELIARIKVQAAKCKYTDCEQNMTSRLLFAMHDQRTKEVLIDKKDLSFNSAINIALTLEDRKKFSNSFANNIVFEKSVNKVVKVCYRCGGKGHMSFNCKFKDFKCNKCSKVGHLAKVCKAQTSSSKSNSAQNNEKKEKAKNVFGAEILNISLNGKNKELIKLQFSQNCVDFQLDSGAEVSIINLKKLKSVNRNAKIRKTTLRVKGVGDRWLKVLGVVSLVINSVDLPLVVVEEEMKYPILGIDAMDALNPNWRSSFQLHQNVEVLQTECDGIVNQILKDFANVFDNSKVSKIKDFEIKLEMKENASPIFRKNYEAPLALKDRIEAELRNLENLGIISPVNFSSWASPVIPVLKKNGNVRLCGDFKQTINAMMQDDKYPLPLIEDILNEIGNNVVFTVLDLSNAYLQLELEENSKEYTTVNTHLGLYRYNRLPFGVKTGPAKFQKVIDVILKGIEGTAAYMDDIVIAGKNITECIERTRQVLTKLEKYNVKVNFEKSNFFKDEITYLGFRISKDGIKPSDSKLEAITNAREPKDVTEVRAYLGMLNYYRRFIENLADKLTKMQELLHKDAEFLWTKEHEIEFKESKRLLLNSKAVVSYDNTRKTIVAADASKTGIGAVISQMVDGEERIVCCVSRTLSETEKRYPQIEKEALALIYAIRKFHKFIFGRKFELITDHEPLRAIFAPNKKIPQFALNRLQHYALILQAYDFDIKFKKGSLNSNADMLSRLSLERNNDDEDDDKLWVNVLSLTTTTKKLNMTDVKNFTEKDMILSIVKKFIENGFPVVTKDASLKPFVNRKFELHCLEGCIFWNNRLIIPFELRRLVLEILHENHNGIVKCKQLARQEVWWPSMDAEIENMCKDCEACNTYANKPNVDKELAKWKFATRCFERVHIDFFSKYGMNFLLMMDAFSGWMEVKVVDNLQAGTVIEIMRDFMATFGLIPIIVSDNGPPFTSWEFQEFCSNNRIKHYFSPAYHPQSNGAAERGVQTIKSSLKKLVYEAKQKGEQTSINKLLANFLSKYRNTPRNDSQLSPADMVFNFRILTDLRLLKTNEINLEDGEANANFKVDEFVWVLRTGKVKDDRGNWEKGKVSKVISEKLLEINVGGKIKNFHVGQVKKQYLSKGGNVVYDNRD